MKNQQLDLLRVGQLALRAARSDFTFGKPTRNLYARGLAAMHDSTGLPVETCQEVMEKLARQDSQQSYEWDLQAIHRAAEEARRG